MAVKRAFPDTFDPVLPNWVKKLVVSDWAQNGGNRTLLGNLDLYMYRFFFSKTGPGTFVEVGGFDGGVDQANTYYVLECQLGWSGVLIEADLQNYQKLEKNRGGQKGVITIHAGVCAEPQMIYMNGNGIMSTSVSEPGMGGVAALCLPLSLLVQPAHLSHIDFLSLNVEGNEFDVLTGHDFVAVPINTILVEMMSRHENSRVNAYKRWALHQLGYCQFEVDVGAFVVTNEVWISNAFAQKSLHSELSRDKNSSSVSVTNY